MKIFITTLFILFFGNYSFAQSIQYSGNRTDKVSNSPFLPKSIKKNSQDAHLEIRTPLQKNDNKTSKELIGKGDQKKTSYNMIIKDLGGYEDNMPISKPDSTIVYTLLNQRL
jgi:hypothetical protein